MIVCVLGVQVEELAVEVVWVVTPVVVVLLLEVQVGVVLVLEVVVDP